jgi:hypothetical protein
VGVLELNCSECLDDDGCQGEERCKPIGVDCVDFGPQCETACRGPVPALLLTAITVDTPPEVADSLTAALAERVANGHRLIVRFDDVGAGWMRVGPARQVADTVYEWGGGRACEDASGASGPCGRVVSGHLTRDGPTFAFVEPPSGNIWLGSLFPVEVPSLAGTLSEDGSAQARLEGVVSEAIVRELRITRLFEGLEPGFWTGGVGWSFAATLDLEPVRLHE